MSENERRSGAKLHKQPEVEDDDGDEGQQHRKASPQAALSACGDQASSNNGAAPCTAAAQSSFSSTPEPDVQAAVPGGTNISGVRTPTIQSASSSSETSPDEGQTQAPVMPVFTRKQTLTRTPALEGTSPPPESLSSQQIHHTESRGPALDGSSPSLTNGGGGGGSVEAASGQVPSASTPISLGQLQKKGCESSSQEAKEFLLASQKVSNDSGHGTLDTTDAGSDTSVLSRDSSLESSTANLYKDTSGVDIPRFIRETMLKSAKDKRTVLAYEKQLIDFCSNENSQVLKMAEASSYDRMIAHRLSAFMGLEHNVDSTGKSVIINKTENMRKVKITDFIKVDDGEQDTKKKILLKKPASLDEKHSRAGKGQFGSHRAKSLEERQQIYSEARERIFKDGENQGDTLNTPSLLGPHGIPQLYHQRSLDSAHPISSSAQLLSLSSSPSSSSSPGYHQHQHQQQQVQPAYHHQHHHHLQPARWASTDSAPGRFGQGATDLRASTMIKSHSYGGVGSNPTSVQALMGSEPTMAAVMAFPDSQKDAANVMYNSQPCQGSTVAPPLCPTSQQQSAEQAPSDEAPSPLVASAGLQQPSQSPSQQQPQAGPNPSVAYLISSDYTTIPLGSLIIDPSTMQPHVNADGSLYRFDPSCPPPFMAQPLIQSPSPSGQQLPYQMENLSMSEVNAKFAGPGFDQGAGVTGQLVMSHPQATLTYPSSHPIQFSQGQYYPSISPSPATVPGQPPFHVLAYTPAATPMPPAGQGHQVHPLPQILQASPLEAQGQTTVPMPAVGVPGVPSNLSGATAYVLGPAPYEISAGAGVTMYAPPYPPTMETLASSGVGGLGSPLSHQQHHQLVQYNIAAAPYGQPEPQLHQLQQQQQKQQQPQVVVPHSGAGHTAFFTAVQAATSSSTPTPPPPHHPSGMALSHIPPPPQQFSTSLKALSQPHLHYPQHQLQQQGQHLTQQQQQQQPAVFFSPALSNMTMSPLTQVFPGAPSSNPQMSQPSSTSSASTSTPKPGQSSFIQYHSSPPPPPPPPPPAHLHHQQSLTQHHQVMAPASNGHHHHHHKPTAHPLQQLTLSCSGQPLSLCPTSTSNSSTGPQQLVAYHQGRPMGTFIHVGGGPSVQPSVQPLVQHTPVSPAQLQQYQILRPTGPELRMMNPGSIRPRVASLQFSNPLGPQAHSKPSNRQQKKGKRASSESKDTEEISLVGGGGGGDSVRAGGGGRLPQTMLGSIPVQATPQPQHQQPQHHPHHHHHHHQQQQQQQPLIVTPLLPGMMGHPHIAPHSSHTRQDPPARL